MPHGPPAMPDGLRAPTRGGSAGMPASCRYSVTLGEWGGAWPPGCIARAAGGHSSPVACSRACGRDSRCAMWGHNSTGCWRAWLCTEAADASWRVANMSGHLLQHGVVAVGRPIARGVSLAGLVDVGPLCSGSEGVRADQCRRLCYADVECTSWQSGGGACWLQRPSDSGPRHRTRREGTLEGLAVVGELIIRECPVNAHFGWLYIGELAACLGACLCLCAALRGRGVNRKSAPKHSRLDSRPSSPSSRACELFDP